MESRNHGQPQNSILLSYFIYGSLKIHALTTMHYFHIISESGLEIALHTEADSIPDS